MNYIEIVDNQHTHTTREPYTDDTWDRGDSETYHSIEGIRVVDTARYHDLVVEFEIIPDKVYYLVSVSYSTGDSFGRYEGQLDHIDLFQTNEAAEALAKLISANERPSSKKSKSIIKYKTENGTEVECYCGSWKGYFESFNGVDVRAVTTI